MFSVRYIVVALQVSFQFQIKTVHIIRTVFKENKSQSTECSSFLGASDMWNCNSLLILGNGSRLQLPASYVITSKHHSIHLQPSVFQIQYNIQ